METCVVRSAQFLAQSKNSACAQYISLLSSGFQETKGVFQEEVPSLPLRVSLVASANLRNPDTSLQPIWKDCS